MNKTEIRKLVDLAWAQNLGKPSLVTYESWERSILNYKGKLTYQECADAVGKVQATPGHDTPVTFGEIIFVIEAPRREAQKKAALEARVFKGGDKKEDPAKAKRIIDSVYAARPELKRLFN